MSVVIRGGNECMERQYSNACRKYGCKAKVFCKPCADGWGDGQWMRDREEKCRTAGAELAADSVIANDAPGDEETQQCFCCRN